MARHSWKHLETWWELEIPVKGIDRCQKCGLTLAWKAPYKPPRGGCNTKEKEVSMREPELKLRCPVCGSSEIRTSKVTGISWCRRCGHEAPKAEFEEKE